MMVLPGDAGFIDVRSQSWMESGSEEEADGDRECDEPDGGERGELTVGDNDVDGGGEDGPCEGIGRGQLEGDRRSGGAELSAKKSKTKRGG